MKLKFDIDKVTSKGICIKFETKEEAKYFFNYMYSFGLKNFNYFDFRYTEFPLIFRIFKKSEDIKWSWDTERSYTEREHRIYNYKDIEISEYPCYKILKYGKIIVEFNDEDSGYCVIEDSRHFKYMEYSTTWIEDNFRKLTLEEHIKYHDILKKYKEDKARLLEMNNKEDKMELRYKIKEGKTINAEQIMNCHAHKCKDGLNSFLMHFGANDVDWNKENEDWIANNVPGGIDWLYSNGFIEKNEKVYDKNFYFCQYNAGRVGFLSKVDENYMWISLSGIKNCFHSKKYESIKDAIYNLQSRPSPWKVKGFDTLQDGLKFYGLF